MENMGKNKSMCFKCGKLKEDYEALICDKCWERGEKDLKKEVK